MRKQKKLQNGSGRANSEGQSDRVKNGEKCHQVVRERLQGLLERVEFGNAIEMKPKCKVVGQEDVDFAFYLRDSSILIAAVAVKKSFRERWRVDAWTCGVVKHAHPTAVWIQFTDVEYPNDPKWTQARQENALKTIRTRWNSAEHKYDRLISLISHDTVIEALNFLEAHLRKCVDGKMKLQRKPDAS